MTDERPLQTDIWGNKLESLTFDWESSVFIDPDSTVYEANVNNVLERLRSEWGAIKFSHQEQMIDLLFPLGGLANMRLSFHHRLMPTVRYSEIYKYFSGASLLVPRESAEELEAGDVVFNMLVKDKSFYKSPKGHQSWIYYSELLQSGARYVRDPEADRFGTDAKMRMRYASQMASSSLPIAFNPEAVIPNFILIENLSRKSNG